MEMQRKAKVIRAVLFMAIFVYKVHSSTRWTGCSKTAQSQSRWPLATEVAWTFAIATPTVVRGDVFRPRQGRTVMGFEAHILLS